MEFTMKILVVIIILLVAAAVAISLTVGWGGQSQTLIDKMFNWFGSLTGGS